MKKILALFCMAMTLCMTAEVQEIQPVKKGKNVKYEQAARIMKGVASLGAGIGLGLASEALVYQLAPHHQGVRFLIRLIVEFGLGAGLIALVPKEKIDPMLRDITIIGYSSATMAYIAYKYPIHTIPWKFWKSSVLADLLVYLGCCNNIVKIIERYIAYTNRGSKLIMR